MGLSSWTLFFFWRLPASIASCRVLQSNPMNIPSLCIRVFFFSSSGLSMLSAYRRSFPRSAVYGQIVQLWRPHVTKRGNENQGGKPPERLKSGSRGKSSILKPIPSHCASRHVQIRPRSELLGVGQPNRVSLLPSSRAVGAWICSVVMASWCEDGRVNSLARLGRPVRVITQ